MWAQSDPAVRTFAAADRLVPDWPGSDTSLEVLQCGVPACGCSRQPPRRWWLGAAIRLEVTCDGPHLCQLVRRCWDPAAAAL